MTRAVPSPLQMATSLSLSTFSLRSPQDPISPQQQLGPPSKPLPHPNLTFPLRCPPHRRCSGLEGRLLLSHAHAFSAASPFLHTGAQSSVPCFFAPHSPPPSPGPLSHHSLLPSLLFNSLSPFLAFKHIHLECGLFSCPYAESAFSEVTSNFLTGIWVVWGL